MTLRPDPTLHDAAGRQEIKGENLNPTGLFFNINNKDESDSRRQNNKYLFRLVHTEESSGLDGSTPPLAV